MQLWTVLWCQLLVDVCTYPKIIDAVSWESVGCVFVAWVVFTFVCSIQKWWLPCICVGVLVTLPYVPNVIACISMLWLRNDLWQWTMPAHCVVSILYWMMFRSGGGVAQCVSVAAAGSVLLVCILLMYNPSRCLKRPEFCTVVAYIFFSACLVTEEHISNTTKIAHAICGLFTTVQPINQINADEDIDEDTTE